jgi:hypothetical protein
MATYIEQLQRIWRQYEEEGNPIPVTARDVARWAIVNKLWQPRPADIESQCAEELARAAREEYRTDSDGRRYRARHSVRIKRNGIQQSLWADIDSAPRTHMQRAFAQRRKQIVGDCHQLRIDIDHYNDIHKDELPIQMVFDFTEDLAELQSFNRLVNDQVFSI